VRPAFDGVEVTTGFTVDCDLGVISFDVPPAAGVSVSAGFEFDVPVRFESDVLNISAENFRAGLIGDIGLIEVRV
jgi:uncharacterized protein (TIGR02217 family)